MLKKHIQKSSLRMPTSKKASVQCSVCNPDHCPAQIFCVCNSGHVIYKEKCQHSDGSEGRQESGDFVSDTKTVKHVRKLKKSKSLNASAQVKDLASGDHDKRSKTPRKLHGKRKAKSDSKIKEKKKTAQGDDNSSDDGAKEVEEIETILEYKNTNYDDNSSSLISPSSNQEIEEVLELIEKRVCPRPVSCPVQTCSKIIAMDSVMLHFYFDHSKVPRMTLNTYTSRQVTLLPSNLCVDSQCFAVFLSQNKKEVILNFDTPSQLMNGNQNDKKSLILMGARMQVEGLKAVNTKNNAKLIPVRSLQTQTELVDKKRIQEHGTVVKKDEVVPLNKSSDMFDKDEIVLLWLCKLDDGLNTYSISIQTKDKKYEHKYTGEPVHIRESQEVHSVYQKSECLIVHGTAANRLLDEQNQLYVAVNILD